MTDELDARARLGESPRWVAAARLAIGLAQGLVLYLIVRDLTQSEETWLKSRPGLLAPLLLTSAYLPVVALAGLGRIRSTTLAAWLAAAGALVWMMAWWLVERSRAAGPDLLPGGEAAVFLVIPFAAVALFIGHNLVAAADRARRPVAPYPDYFDLAWKHGVQLALSLAFTGSVWLLLGLGTALFSIIGLSFLQKLVVQPWFSLPVTTLAFALAVQLTDVRDGLIRGVRAVALMLLSWLLILMTVLAAGFVIALPFTGLDGLWETGSATALVLFAAASLIVLINAAYQDGREENRPPVVLRWTVRVAAGLLTPLALIAVWGLALRIGQHGLTPDRIIAAACALLGAVYAGGYLLAAARPGPWMRTLEPTNVLNAAVAFSLIALLSSPILDPTRLSVADQVARLERGAVAPARFDFSFLRWQGGKAGDAALKRLARSSNPEIANRARTALTEIDSFGERRRERPAELTLTPFPADAPVPEEFLTQARGLRDLLHACADDGGCLVQPLDLDASGDDEMLVVSHGQVKVFNREADGRWIEWAEYWVSDCGAEPSDAREVVRSGRLRTAPPAFPDLEVGGRRLRTQEGAPECPAPALPAPR